MTTATHSISSKLTTSFRLPAVLKLWARFGSRRSSEDGDIGDAPNPAEDNPSSLHTTEPSAAPVNWSDWRIDLMERLWGTGFLLPGGTEFVHDLTKPLNLGSKASVLVLSAGMGGPSNLIAEEFGAFIDGIEPDPELAAASTKRAAVVEGISRVTIKNIAIDDDAAFERKYDAVFAQEILLQLADKSRLFQHCVDALKKNGKLVITDFTRPDDIDAVSLDPWLKREAAASVPLDDAEMRALFKQAGFSVRTVEDMTERYINLVLDGWVAFEGSLRANAADREILLGMIAEAERWTERVALLKHDQIRYTRIFATKKTVF